MPALIGTRLLLLSLAIAFASLVAGCGGKSAPKTIVIGHDSAAGLRAAAEASVTTPVAKDLSIRVTARPTQRVTASWTILCHVGTLGSTRDADDFRGAAPLTVPMRDVGFGEGAAATCSVVADARLSKSGRLKVEILGPEIPGA